jgi:beta-aspartyl-peptidase (threonine type)
LRTSPPAIAVHGGAGNWSEEALEKAKSELLKALERGYEEFRKGSSLEAVVEAVAYTEDSGVFNAGRGATLTEKGTRRTDAGVMLGPGLKAGAVANTRLKNPIRAALEVLREGRHVLIVSEEAEAIYGRPVSETFDTVGAVAIDRDGTLATATSTGGISGKREGRVGDSPIPGAGFYASYESASSCTGIGEYILRLLPAKEVDILVSMGFDAESAALAVTRRMTRVFGNGTFGIIVLDKYGNFGYGFNTRAMPRGLKDSNRTLVEVP